MKYRSRTDIITAVLRSVGAEGTTKTRIMYNAYLSYAQSKEYLDFLIARELLSEEGGLFRPTPKGMELLGKIEGISDLLSPAKPVQGVRSVEVETPAERRSRFALF